MKRRQILQLGATQILALALPYKVSSAEEFKVHRNISPSILQGATDDSKTQFSVVYDPMVTLNCIARSSDGTLHSPDAINEYIFEDDLPKVTKIYFSNLTADINYELLLFNANTNHQVDARYFSCLSQNKKDFKFALCSCMDDNRHDPKIWDSLNHNNPDIIFFLGDSVYTDWEKRRNATPRTLWRRFSEARQTLKVYYQKQLIPILATWDDHDFGRNDAYNSYPYIKESQENFKTFFAQEESHCRHLNQGPGVSNIWTYGDHLFALMDNRSFRQKKDSKIRYAHWGEEQERWLEQLSKKHGKTVWVLSGTQMFPRMILKESFSGDHNYNFQKFLRSIGTQKSRFIFCSGDVHFSEITKIDNHFLGYRTYELTSSSIHSKTAVHPFFVWNPNRVVSTSKKNYLLVTAPTKSAKDLECRVVSQGASDKVFFDQQLRWS